MSDIDTTDAIREAGQLAGANGYPLAEAERLYTGQALATFRHAYQVGRLTRLLWQIEQWAWNAHRSDVTQMIADVRALMDERGMEQQ